MCLHRVNVRFGIVHVFKLCVDFYFAAVFSDVAFVNNTAVICQNPKVTALNSCIEIDLTGQVISDSIGTRMYSGR